MDHQLNTFRKADGVVEMASQALSAGLPIGLLSSCNVLSIGGVHVVIHVMVTDALLAGILDQFFIKNCTVTKPGADSIPLLRETTTNC
jgi:hypothetical protein